MDLIELCANGEEHLLASGITLDEASGALDWWRHTKPLGCGVKIVIREHGSDILAVQTSGTEGEPMNPGPHPVPLADLSSDGPLQTHRAPFRCMR